MPDPLDGLDVTDYHDGTCVRCTARLPGVDAPFVARGVNPMEARYELGRVIATHRATVAAARAAALGSDAPALTAPDAAPALPVADATPAPTGEAAPAP